MLYGHLHQYRCSKRAEAEVERLEIEKISALYQAEQISNAKLREIDQLKSSLLRNMSHEIEPSKCNSRLCGNPCG